jgi:lipopolysaccharide export system protein LptA
MFITRTLVALPLVTGPAFGADEALRLSDADTVVVRADEARESDAGDAYYFSGNIRIYAPQWAVLADKAELVGRIENPDQVIVEGAPARIRVQVKDNKKPIEGRSDRVEYDRRNDLVRLSGTALLDDDGRVVNSEMIEYFLNKRLFRTGGDRRVRVVATPK